MATSSIDRARRLTFVGPKRADGVTVLSVYLFLLIAIPSRLVFTPLGGAGSPASVVGLICGAWWIWSQVQRIEANQHGFQPVRCAFIITVFAFLASFVAAMVRPIEGTEFSSAHLGMVLLAGWGGVLLLANDGIPSMDRLLALTRRVVAAGGALATLGIVQFLTGQTLVDLVSIPGLSANHDLSSLTLREGFTRPPGTATHPIEYGAVITMILPLALALAMSDTRRSALRRWYPALAIVISVPLSISRSALLSATVGCIVIVISWPPVTRRIAYVGAAVLAVFVYLAIPGMLGSLLGLFSNIGGDSSALSRTGSYPIALQFIERSPLFGRGFGTFLPSYRILDNQYLGLLIEIGAIGLASVLALVLVALTSAIRARGYSRDPLVRQAAQGLTAAIASGASSLALFDGLSFPMSAGMFFLLLGMAGAVLRLSRQMGPVQTPGRSTTV